jgi:hypothetical protein
MAGHSVHREGIHLNGNQRLGALGIFLGAIVLVVIFGGGYVASVAQERAAQPTIQTCLSAGHSPAECRGIANLNGSIGDND